MRPEQTALAEASELSFRLETVRAGVRVALAMAAGMLAYLLLSWDRPHRPLLLAVAGLVIAESWAVARLPHRRIMLAGRHDAFLLTWNVAHIAATAVCASLDGGPTSPITLVLFVSVAFASVSLPRPAVGIVAALDVAALLGIAAVAGRWSAALVFWAMALIVIAVVGAGIAGDRWRRGTALQSAQDEMLQRLARIVEYRDNETGAHVNRMSEYCAIVARALGFSAAAANELRVAATMHDIGKVGVPDSILLKPGLLTPEERATMERHTIIGHQMLADSSNPLVRQAAEIALSHHERWDGAGYPLGRRGDEIPLSGRIAAVADVFDAITSDRIYREPATFEDALRHLRDERGRQFDPAVVDAFEASLDEIRAVAGESPRTSRGSSRMVTAG